MGRSRTEIAHLFRKVVGYVKWVSPGAAALKKTGCEQLPASLFFGKKRRELTDFFLPGRLDPDFENGRRAQIEKPSPPTQPPTFFPSPLLACVRERGGSTLRAGLKKRGKKAFFVSSTGGLAAVGGDASVRR